MSISKQQIIEAAAKYFQEKGYHATSMFDIANELGVNKASLYYHVKSKESILCDIFDRAMDTLQPRLKEIKQSNLPVIEKIRQVILIHILSIIEETPILTVFYNERNHLPSEHLALVKHRRRNLEEAVAEIFREGIASGFIKNLDVLPVVYGILGMCNWIYQWYDPKGRLSPVELAEVYSDLVLKGCLKNPEASD